MDIRATISSLLWLGGIAFVLSLILTPILRDVFRSYGVVDKPDQGRKFHKHPIPRVGGIAIAISYAIAFLVAPAPPGSILHDNLYLVRGLLPAAAVIFATGVIDDLFGLKPWQKLIGQFGGAVIAYSAGVRVLIVVGVATQDWWSFPVTILWLLFCCNAFNLVDGMDGLAGGIGLFSTLTIFIAALVHQSPALALVTFPLAGCLLGFLCYNFNPATIFLGDSGSLLIGFLLGCFGVIWTQKSATVLGMTAPLMALAIPLLDTCLSIVRRTLKRQPIFTADRGHIHHKLLERGLTPKRAVLVVYGVCSLVACFSLLQSTVRNNRISGLITIVFCAVAWIGIQYLGYAEFSIAGKMLFSGDFQKTLKVQLELHAFEREIEKSASLEECWLVLRKTAEGCGFHCKCLYIDSDLCFQAERPAGAADEWNLRVPLSETSYLELARPFRSEVSSGVVGPFVDVIHGSLRPKIEGLAQIEIVGSKGKIRAGLAAAGGA
jgi:UDP-GlcNAc:undecaprenyl-phosphate/decaprenyl-phosphate GlcNAc-1-phosphate transferase